MHFVSYLPTKMALQPQERSAWQPSVIAVLAVRLPAQPARFNRCKDLRAILGKLIRAAIHRPPFYFVAPFVSLKLVAEGALRPRQPRSTRPAALRQDFIAMHALEAAGRWTLDGSFCTPRFEGL